MSITIVVPTLPPSVNHAYRNRKSGGRILRPEARQYMEAVSLLTMNAMHLERWAWTIQTYLRVNVKLYWPNGRRRDTHNYTKVLLDGVAYGLGVDDRWFLVHEEQPEIDRKEPRVVVTIKGAA